MTHTRRLLVLMAVATALLAGCGSTTRKAPVVEKSATRGDKAPREKRDAKGTYTVEKGDTLIRIALEHGLDYRDIAAWNRLADPDDLRVGQVLRLTEPPRSAAGAATAASGSGVTTTAPIDMGPSAVPRKTEPRADKKPYGDSVADARADDKAAPAPGGIVPGATVTATDDEKLSWMWPSDGRIVATFDEGRNKGIDIAGKAGQQVVAAGAGKVMYAGSSIRGYGKLVIVKHSNSLLSAYAHNRAILVKEGDVVSKGQTIAEMGDSDSDIVKLHFEIRQQGKPVDPTKLLPNR